LIRKKLQRNQPIPPHRATWLLGRIVGSIGISIKRE
jgi:hypothetical protein